MIIDANFIKGDIRLADHLLAEKNNRTIRQLHEHDRDAPPDLHMSLRMFRALKVAHSRARISFVHVIVAPDHELSNDELEAVLFMIDSEHGVGDHARKVIAHDKGDRALHYHIVYPAVGPDGRAAKSQRSHVRDELIGRRFEIQFGECIRNGKYHHEVAAILNERGLISEARRLISEAEPASSARINNRQKQQGVRLNLRPEALQAMIVEAWRDRSQQGSFAKALAQRGVEVGFGNKPDVLVAVHLETGMMLPLRRAMYRDVQIKAAELRAHFPSPESAASIAKRGPIIKRTEEIEPLFDRPNQSPPQTLVLPRSSLNALPENTAQPKNSTPEDHHVWASKLRSKNYARNARIDKAMAQARLFENQRTRYLLAWLTTAGLLASGAGMPIILAAYGLMRISPLLYASRKRGEAKELIAARNAEREIQRLKKRTGKRGTTRAAGSSHMTLANNLIPSPNLDIWDVRQKRRTIANAGENKKQRQHSPSL